MWRWAFASGIVLKNKSKKKDYFLNKDWDELSVSTYWIIRSRKSLVRKFCNKG